MCSNCGTIKSEGGLQDWQEIFWETFSNDAYIPPEMVCPNCIANTDILQRVFDNNHPLHACDICGLLENCIHDLNYETL
jgi:hypothetical protein